MSADAGSEQSSIGIVNAAQIFLDDGWKSLEDARAPQEAMTFREDDMFRGVGPQNTKKGADSTLN